MSPSLILLLYRQTERDAAEHMLLLMEATRAATGVSWLQKGADLYGKTIERFQRMAGIGAAAKRPDDAKANRKQLGAKLAKLGLTPGGKAH